MKKGQATYSPEDNKLRLYIGRVPREEFLKLRAEAEAEAQEQETAEERRERIEADKADAWHDQAVDREAWRNE